MSAAVDLEDLYGRDGEKFARMFQHSLDEVSAIGGWRAGHETAALQDAVARLIPRIESLAFMTLLSVKDKVRMRPDLIGRLRSLYVDISTNVLDNPALALLREETRESLERSCLELASNICVADAANSTKINEIIAQVKARG